MCQIIQFPVIPRKPEDRSGWHPAYRCGQHLYRCIECGEESEITVMFVLPAVHCDGCGAEMCPVEMEAK